MEFNKLAARFDTMKKEQMWANASDLAHVYSGRYSESHIWRILGVETDSRKDGNLVT
jgi:hypothetical protein